MKKVFFSLVLLMSATLLFAQNDRHDQNNSHDRNNNTPKPVQDAFNRDHPNMNNNAQWSQTNGQWHATYNDKNNNRDDYYDNKGNRKYSRVAWDRKNLPNSYDKRIRSKYHATNYQVTKIERPNNQSLFELVLNIGGKNKTVYTDERGNEVKFSLRF